MVTVVFGVALDPLVWPKITKLVLYGHHSFTPMGGKREFTTEGTEFTEKRNRVASADSLPRGGTFLDQRACFAGLDEPIFYFANIPNPRSQWMSRLGHSAKAESPKANPTPWPPL